MAAKKYPPVLPVVQGWEDSSGGLRERPIVDFHYTPETEGYRYKVIDGKPYIQLYYKDNGEVIEDIPIPEGPEHRNFREDQERTKPKAAEKRK